MSKLTIKETVSDTRYVFSRNSNSLLLLGLLLAVLSIVMTTIVTFTFFGPIYGTIIWCSLSSDQIVVEFHEGEDFSVPDDFFEKQREQQQRIDETLPVVAGVSGTLALLFAIAFSFVYLWLYAGQIVYVLETFKGNSPPIKTIFKHTRHLWRLVCYYAYVTIIIMLSFVPVYLVTFLPGTMYLAYAFYIPDGPETNSVIIGTVLIFLGTFLFSFLAFYIQLIYSFGPFFMIDSNLSVSKAMRESRRKVHANFLTVFIITLILWLISTVGGMLIPLIWILTIPVLLLVQGILYMKMTAQRIDVIPEEASIVTMDEPLSPKHSAGTPGPLNFTSFNPSES